MPAQGIDVHWISITGVRGRGLAAWLTAPFKIVAAIVQALGAAGIRVRVVRQKSPIDSESGRIGER